ncbi:hypothetical protein GN316_05935 [Xylophilus sp. Kf1]|nr:hypothetical protein [Xylophilus sp. Kf1]
MPKPPPTARHDPAAQFRPPAGGARPLSLHLAALLLIDEPVAPFFAQAAARQRQRDRTHRAQVDAVLALLQAGGGVPAFEPRRPPASGFCFRHAHQVLAIGRHADLAEGGTPAFELHLHGPGLMARRDGAWVEDPDAAFFEALESASRRTGWPGSPWPEPAAGLAADQRRRSSV